MQHDNLFLRWITKQLTKNEYLMLSRIIYSFKKYQSTEAPCTEQYCRFKDGESIFIMTHLPLSLFDMANLLGQSREYLFNQWLHDCVIFWPYEENPELEKARLRLITKHREDIGPYKHLHIFRENKYGDIMLFTIPNNNYSNCLLPKLNYENWINCIFYKQSTIDNTDYVPEIYVIMHNTKAIIKKLTGISNKKYKKYLAEIDKRDIFSNDQSYNYISGKKLLVYTKIKDIIKYDFDITILYNMLEKIDSEKELTVFGEPFKIARYDKLTTILLDSKDKLKEVK